MLARVLLLLLWRAEGGGGGDEIPWGKNDGSFWFFVGRDER